MKKLIFVGLNNNEQARGNLQVDYYFTHKYITKLKMFARQSVDYFAKHSVKKKTLL